MIRLLALGALLLSGCATPLSQVPPAGMPASVAAPEITVGDTWTYHVRDGFTGIPRENQRNEVVRVGGGHIEVARSNEREDAIQVYDRDWNWLRRPATNLKTFEYHPAYEAFAFPLIPGKRWREKLVAVDPVDGRKFPVVVQGSVLGWERVKVPAGEFDALKVDRRVFFDYWEYAVRGRSVIHEIEWYVPAVKQSVRREASSRYLSISGAGRDPGFMRVRGGGGRDDDGGPRYVLDDWLIYELANYSVH